MTAHARVIDHVWSSRDLAEDLERLTQFGGRFAGSESEAASRVFLLERLGAIPGIHIAEQRFEYSGWAREKSELEVRGASVQRLPCHPLILCPDTPVGGLEAEVVDVGRGTPQQFDAVGSDLRGRLALVRHEYPFAAGTIHRRAKYNLSRERGAAGFVIAGTLPGHVLVTGSSGSGAPGDIPAIGVSLETGATLGTAAAGRRPRAHLSIKSERRRVQGVNLVAEVPGQGPEWVIVCAHYDGHDLAQSALDNATGVVAAIEVLRAIAPHCERLRRGLRVVLFTVEEWGLVGSQEYVTGLTEEDARSIALVVNLDTVAGSPNLTCLTSGFAELNPFVETIGHRLGVRVGAVPPLMRNSDHFSFIGRGIPAMRMVAGFDEPNSGAKYLLTSADTVDKVALSELKAATLVATEFVWQALVSPEAIARHRTVVEVEQLFGSFGFPVPTVFSGRQ